MYFQFKKSMIYAFTAISILVSIPCTIIIVLKFLEKQGLQDYVTQNVSKLSIGVVFKARLNQLQAYVYNKSNNVFLADLLMYFNMLGVICLLVHSILIRRNLVQMA